ncbi:MULTISPECIES: DUF3892 domain-containing protein [Burkholderiales]|jgi:hypothetical protein|uniref:Uncharacterized protein n=1 Tax=Sphaerotilus microaerophilus TaxID=2914710 RepID=A0ABM7YPB4_9BURK|nr:MULTISPECIES: DUF3892 domain-containing protein [Burkholderiales]BDI06332.1 hypothetical protein CATMQ487_33020 [Sphaerotilus sp. FB-5]
MTRLIVPLSLDALVVRRGDASVAPARTAWQAAARPALNAAPRRQDLAPPPFTDTAAPRASGVHLHWAVPDALAVRRADAAQFPPLPCRWLVVRLHGLASAGVPRKMAAWLLPNIHAADAVALRDGHLTPHAAGSGSVPVSVRGRGWFGPHPSWALSYDEVQGRLAFHDPLDDANVEGPLAYTVIGWYTHPAFDPLTPAADTPATPTSVGRLLERFRWAATLEGAPPTASIFHGSALAIAWPGTRWPGDDGGRLSAEAGGPPAADEVRLALADTLAAAAVTLLDGVAEPALAALSEAVLTGDVLALSQADGAARLDEARHQGRFRSVAPPLYDDEVIYQEVEAEAPAPVPPASVVTALASSDLVPVTADFRALHRTWERLSGAADASRGVAADAPAAASRFTNVSYPVARQWMPGNPVLVASGLGRSLRHGGDGRFHVQGLLDCRVTGQTVTAAVPPLLAPWVAARDVPEEVGALVAELALIDPGSVGDLASAGTSSAAAMARAAWWDFWSTDWRSAPAGTGWNGRLPSPVGVTRPSRPWNPLRIDWEAVLLPTPDGATHWRLGEVDFEASTAFTVDEGRARALRGIGWLSPAPSALLAAAAGGALDSGADLAAKDLVAASLEGLFDRTRGTPPGVWVSGRGIDDSPSRATVTGELYAAAGSVAGAWRLGRVRVVDTFGQVMTLHDPSSGTPPLVPAELTLPAGAGPAAIALRPRFTAPAALEARFLAPDSDTEAGSGQNPVCGFLLPDPLGDSLEFADSEGAIVARLLLDPETGRSRLEEAPGVTVRPPAAAEGDHALLGPAGAALAADTLAALATVASAVVGADRSGAVGGALPALLRLIDTTRGAVDVTGRVGDEQLSLLVGNPLTVLRLAVSVVVDDAQSPAQTMAVPCRIGSIGSLHDGVLAWFAEDRAEQVHPVHAAVSEAAQATSAGGFVGEPLLWLKPGQVRRLVLLTTPGADVTLTTGLLPVKKLQMQREWTERPLRRLTPTLAFDNLLRDPDAMSVPLPAGPAGTWTWWRRPSPGEPWRAEAVSLDPPSAEAGAAVEVEDGYLRLKLADETLYSGVPMQVTCIRRWGPQNTIQQLGGLNPDGSSWRMSSDQMVQMIESGRFRFFVRAVVAGIERDVRLVVDTSPRGRKFPRTDMDDTAANNLEQLPTCS